MNNLWINNTEKEEILLPIFQINSKLIIKFKILIINSSKPIYGVEFIKDADNYTKLLCVKDMNMKWRD